RDKALFHGMVYSGVDLPANVEATKNACKDGLALYGVKIAPAAGPDFSRHLSEEQKQKCTAGCYELLVIWAEAEVQPEAGSRTPDPEQIVKALGLLDRASQLKLAPTGAYHLRRA